MKSIGILTGGGDCPGLNSVIRAIVRRGLIENYKILGIKNGWKGLLDKDVVNLDIDSVSGILHRGGTILRTSRTNPYKSEGEIQKVVDNFESLGFDALIPIGGEDTLGVAAKLYRDFKLPVIGVPKTIDNDISGTDFTFGFDTAVNIAMECIDKLHTTAESHNRVMVVEVMGRHAGWIALYAGLAGGADAILIPEKPIDMDQVCSLIKKRHSRGKDFSVVVVAEGAKFKRGADVVQDDNLDSFGHIKLGGIGQQVADRLEEKTGYETRVTVLGHIQRGGSPTAYDRILGTRYGIRAFELVNDGRFGRVVVLKGNEISDIPIKDVLGKLKTVDDKIYSIAATFFG
ncbi:MAG: ATP-dependent 6-phosphofructokinase [Candidatus Kaelpia imicola]|nr:ATP-dependent 6-phosphofructokinase [Candidatus Kaelpia imicola]